MTLWHPIFVHFPIAILTLYAACEFIFLLPFFKDAFWERMKGFLAAVGVSSTVPSLLTGEQAEHLLGRGDAALRQLIEVHSTSAKLTTIVFGVLAAGYVLKFALELWPEAYRANPLYWFAGMFQPLVRIIISPAVRLMLALAGLIGITVTGALGGAIAYGPSIDPVANFIYKLFF